MKKLIIKELRLAMHPAAGMFLLLSAMLMIPNYPYSVICFYTSLGIFFICLTGRENGDIPYTAALPVTRGQLVRARISFAVMLELIQLLLAVPFAIMRQSFPIGGNLVGLDANIGFFGSALIMYGIFNAVFFTAYYSAPDRVGIAFVKASIAQAVYMIIAEASVHAVPIMRDVIDTPDSENILPKLILLFFGVMIFTVLTLIAAKNSVRSFSKLDL